MLSPAFVCLFVSRVMQKNLLPFSQNSTKSLTEKTLDSGGKPDHVTLRLGLGRVRVVLRLAPRQTRKIHCVGGCVLAGVCLMVTVS